MLCVPGSTAASMDSAIDAFRHLLKDDQLRDNPPNPDWRAGMPPYDALLPEHTSDHPNIDHLVAAMRAVVDTHPAPVGATERRDRVLLGELYLPIERLIRYYGEDVAGLHLPSNMHLIATPLARAAHQRAHRRLGGGASRRSLA
jgi:alpha-glucosidase